MKKLVLLFLCVIMLPGCTTLEKSNYVNVTSADFVDIVEENESYPVDFSEITFHIICKSEKEYSWNQDRAYILEVRKNDTWYTIPLKKTDYSLLASIIGNNTEYPITIHRDNYDYDFKSGEYRFILDISTGYPNSEKVVYYFKLTNK